MRLAVISDTHLVEPSEAFKRFFDAHLAETDALIHCGDISGKPLLDYILAGHPRVYAVAGNMCEWPVNRDLPPLLRFDLAGRRVGVAHGWGEKATLPQRLYEAFGPEFDVIFYGHTHKPAQLTMGKTLMINPGSLSGETPSMAFVDMGPEILVDFRRYSRQFADQAETP